MKCDEFRGMIPDYLAGTLDNGSLGAFREHRRLCERCDAEAKDMEHMWASLGEIPQEEPSPELNLRFKTTLEAFFHGRNDAPKPVPFMTRLDTIFGAVIPKRPVFQAAAVIFLILTSVVITRELDTRRHVETEVASLKSEMSQMRELLAISLLSQSSAVDRLQGLTMSRSITEPDDRLIGALIKTMNTDSNVNIRLAAVDALGRFSGSEQVRTALVESLERQRSPLVQIALMNLLVELKEERARSVLEELLENQNSPEPVKKRARIGLDMI